MPEMETAQEEGPWEYMGGLNWGVPVCETLQGGLHYLRVDRGSLLVLLLWECLEDLFRQRDPKHGYEPITTLGKLRDYWGVSSFGSFKGSGEEYTKTLVGIKASALPSTPMGRV